MKIFYVSAVAFIASVSPAHAYVDPGTASLALQGLIGVLAAASIFLRHKIMAFFGLFRKKSTPNPELLAEGEAEHQTKATSDK